jgi:flagellar basal body-associated protein FliL
MDIFCDYCGAKLDVEHENCCTQCGAPFDNNASVKAYREEKKRKEEEYRRRQEMRQNEYNASQQPSQSNVNSSRNNASQQQKIVKTIITVFIIMFFAPTVIGIIISVIGGIFSVIGDNIGDNFDNNNGYIEEISFAEESSATQEVQRVNFNETAQTAEYSFICDEVFRTDIMYGGADKGYMYVAFHLKVKNTTDEKQWLSNDLNCVYDGDIGCDRAWGFNEGKSFSTSVALSAGIGSDGYVCYIVPEKAKSVVLSYGDYVRVNIDLRDLSYRAESSQTSTDNT